MKKNLLLTAALCCACLLTGAAKKKSEPGPNRVVTDDEIVYYPAGWKHSGATGIKVGLSIYHRHSRVHGPMPPEEVDWAEVVVRQFKLNHEDTCHAGVADFVNDKNCAVRKCAVRKRTCPVHSKGLAAPARLSKTCTETSPDPGMMGGFCGRYYKRENYRGTFYYYFDRYEDMGEGRPKLAEVTVMFSHGRFLYTAELACAADRVKQYMKHVEFIARSIELKK